MVNETFARKSIASQSLVAVHDVSQTVDPRAQVTTGLRPSGSVDSSPETSSTCRSGGLGVAKDTTCVQAWYGIRHLTTPLRSIHLPVESPRKVGAPESSLQLTRPHGWHSGALGSLACAWPEASSTSSLATSKRRFRWRIRYLGSAGHQQMDTEPCKHRPVSQLRLNDETPVFQRSFTFRLPTKPSV